MNEREAIEHYDRAGDAARGRFRGVRWPDLALTSDNLARLAEGVLEARLDPARLAFGEDFDAAACGDRLAEAWRTDAVQLRYAPEGVLVGATFSVRVTIDPPPDEPDGEVVAATLRVSGEWCVSFTARHHTRPFVDFMGGEVWRDTDGATRRIDAFAVEVSPADAVAWGLNDSAAPR